MSLWGFLVVFGERGKKGEGGVGGWMCWYEPGGRGGGTGIVGLGFEARGEGLVVVEGDRLEGTMWWLC